MVSVVNHLQKGNFEFMIRVSDWKRTGFLAYTVSVMLTALTLILACITTANAESSPREGTIQETGGERATYIVVLKDESLARYSGGVAGYAATSLQAAGSTSGKKKAAGARKLNPRSSESVSYLSYLADQRASAIQKADISIGRGLDISYEYGATIVGFATEMTADEAARVATLDQVSFVELEKISYLHTDAGPVWSGAASVWGVDGLAHTLGEGTIVGIIDTGIDPWNPSFLGTGGDGYVHTNPRGAGNYIGVCDPANTEGVYDPSFPCNEKLIGAWSYPSLGLDARDVDGHGSHTAGTAAGNIVFDAVVEAPTKAFTADISGVAPHANIIAYAACCTGAALTAARDQALLDGVDVVNYSIGSEGPTPDYWNDVEAIQWLALRDAGIFVATSNGNSGNGDATTGSPADLPWLTSVGASSHNRSFLVNLTVNDTSNASITVSGQAMTSGYGPAGIVFSSSIADTDEARLCAPGAFPRGTFDGEIVICERGEYGRVAKGQSVLNGGAGGFVLAQAVEETGGSGAVATDTHVLPALHINYDEYQKLLQFMLEDSVGTVTAVLSGASLDFDDAHGDIMAAFSSRGPNRSDADLIVPSVTAPGRAIMAAYHQGDAGDGSYTYNVIQGTSMSSPHVAGAAALLSALHPDWTPAEMQSALMMTARDTVLDDDATTVATPFAQGSGHINVYLAAKSPLIMDVTKAQYEEANPVVENDFGIRDLNIPGLGNDECIGSCSWTRSVENASDETLTWTISLDGPDGFAASISPSVFTLDPGGSQEIEIKLNVSSEATDGKWHFGSFDLDESSGNYPDLHWPFAVIPKSSNYPEFLDIETRASAGSVEMENLVSRDISNFHTEVTGLKKADRHVFTLNEDNNTLADFPDIFFDDPSTTHFVPITVPADSFSVIAEIVDTTSPDLDMLLFLDADANGPELADVGDPAENPNACQSASGGSAEFCEILSPTPGTYYVAIINFSQATDGGDPVDLATAVIPNNGADEGNLTVIGPVTVSDGSPHTITVSYDEPDMNAIDKLYGYFTVGSDPDNPGNVAKVRVGLEYLGIPDIDINPAALAATVEQDAILTQTLTISTTGGVLDWDVLTPGPGGDQAVNDGGIELGRETNPYWREGASLAFALPMCSLDTCGVDFALDGEWYLWFGGAPDHTSYAEQDITIASGDVAYLTFEMQMGVNPDATATLTVSMDGTAIAIFTEADLGRFSAGYTTVNIDASAYADGESHLLRFDFENPTGENFNMIIDEVSLISGSPEVLCKAIDGIDWLDANPSSGTLSPGQTDLAVIYDATGLSPGVYTDKLCVTSNDPDEPVLSVPVTLTVVRPDRMFSDGFEN